MNSPEGGGAGSPRRWHLPDDDLRAYAGGGLEAPRLWSADAHLAACGHCRRRLTDAAPGLLERGWARIDAELDAPRPGFAESALLRLGVPDDVARLLAATPVLRRSWLAAVALTLLVTVLAANVVSGDRAALLFLAALPLLPPAGVAVSFGPGIDPTYEMAVVAPTHMFRLLLVRTVAVLATTTVLGAAASLALPSFGPAALGWLLPALALTATGLALMPRLGPVAAPSLVGVVWLLVVVGGPLTSGTSVPFTAEGQLTAAAATIAAAVAVLALRDRFDRMARGAVPLGAGYPR
ncbi:hypothetical protein GCM10027168_08400 [Streptomyces capparidis]